MAEEPIYPRPEDAALDMDPECDWTGPKGTRSIGHITTCGPCGARWPEIRDNPVQAAIGGLMMGLQGVQGPHTKPKEHQ